MRVSPPVSVYKLPVNLCSAWCLLILGWAWGPQSRGALGQFPQRAKLQASGAGMEWDSPCCSGERRVLGVSLQASFPSLVFVSHLYPITRGVWCLESLGPRGSPAPVWFLLGFRSFRSAELLAPCPCAFHPPKCSFFPKNIVNTSRLLSSPLIPHQFMPLLFLYCHFSEAWGI